MKLIKLLIIWFLCDINLIFCQPYFWNSTQGPYEGIVRALYESPKGYLLCGTQNNSLFKYDSLQQNWKRVGDSSWLTDIYCMSINKNNHVFLGTRNGVTIAVDTFNIQITEIIDSLAKIIIVKRIDSTKKDTVTVVIDSIITYEKLPTRKVIDTNWYWKTEEVGLEGTLVSTLAIDRLGNIFAGTNKGIFKCRDTVLEGISSNWRRLETGITNNFINTILIDASNYIYVGTFGGGIFKSTDSGENWKQIVDSTFLSTDIRVLTLGPKGEILVGTFGGGIYISENSGVSWRIFTTTGLTSGYISSINVSRNGNIYAGTFQKGIFLLVPSRDKNPERWVDISSNLVNKYIRSILTTSNNLIFIGTVGSGVFYMNNRNLGIDLIKSN